MESSCGNFSGQGAHLPAPACLPLLPPTPLQHWSTAATCKPPGRQCSQAASPSCWWVAKNAPPEVGAGRPRGRSCRQREAPMPPSPHAHAAAPTLAGYLSTPPCGGKGSLHLWPTSGGLLSTWLLEAGGRTPADGNLLGVPAWLRVSDRGCLASATDACTLLSNCSNSQLRLS